MPNFSCDSSIAFGFRMQHETNRKLLCSTSAQVSTLMQQHLPRVLLGHRWDNPDTPSLHQNLPQTSFLKTCVYRGTHWSLKVVQQNSYFFIQESSRRSILFCTRTVGMSPTSVTTFSFQVGIALKDSLSVVENTRTQAWAPRNIQIKYKYTQISQ